MSKIWEDFKEGFKGGYSRRKVVYVQDAVYGVVGLDKWDGRYLDLAQDIAQWSKDPSTKVGAVVVGDKRQILSTGYNGFPRKMDDSQALYEHRETKLKRVVHAEMNAIYNASFTGVSLDGSTIYIEGCPLCAHCALGIIQVGIKRVVMRYPKKFEEPNNRWADSFKDTTKFLTEAGLQFSSWTR